MSEQVDADMQGLSLRAAVRGCTRLCAAAPRSAKRWTSAPPPSRAWALANERVQCNAARQVVLKLKTQRWRDRTIHLACVRDA